MDLAEERVILALFRLARFVRLGAWWGDDDEMAAPSSAGSNLAAAKGG